MLEMFGAFLEMRREASKRGGAFNSKVRQLPPQSYSFQ